MGTSVTGFSFKVTASFVPSYGGKEHTKGSGFEILTGEGFQWKAAENGRVPEGAVQVKLASVIGQRDYKLSSGWA